MQPLPRNCPTTHARFARRLTLSSPRGFNTAMRSLAPSSRTITYIMYACIAGLLLVVLWSGFRP
jgi:hypothetical protein